MVKHFLSYFVLSFAGTKITPTRDLRMDVQSYAVTRAATAKLHNTEFCIYSALYILPLLVLRYFCLLSPHFFAVLHNSMEIGFVDFYEQLLDFRKIGFCREFRFLHVSLKSCFKLVHRLEEFGCIRPILTHILAVADSQQFFVLLVPTGRMSNAV